MALYPIRLLKDKNRHPFFPFNTLESVLVDGTNKNLADLLDEIYTKDEVNTMFTTELSKFSVYDSVSELPATARDGAVAAIDDDETYIMYMFYDNSWHALTQKGDKGDTGSQGPAGPYFTPSVNAAGDISWTNNGGLTNPETRNIKGPQGLPGADGQDGSDGFSPIATVSKSGKVATISITDKNGTTTTTVSDGEDGSGVGVWGSITGTITDQTDLQNALGGKQDTLVSGTNIKTINNTSILGSGNITIQGGSGITTLTSPIRPETLDDGLYLIPGNSTFEFYLLDWQQWLQFGFIHEGNDALMYVKNVVTNNEDVTNFWLLAGSISLKEENNDLVRDKDNYTLGTGYVLKNKTGYFRQYPIDNIVETASNAIPKDHIVDNLTTNNDSYVLSARQGRYLNLNKKGVDVVIDANNKNNSAIISAIDDAYQKFKTGKTANYDIYFYITYNGVNQLFIANFYKLSSSTTQISLVTPYFFQTNLTQNTNEVPGYQYRLKCNLTDDHVTSTEGFYVQTLNLLDSGTGPLLRKSAIEDLINTAIGGALGGNY